MIPAGFKLGKRPYRPNPRRQAAANLVLPCLPAPPREIRWSDGRTSWGMMKNNELGDCVFAGGGHLIQVSSFQATGQMVTPSDDDIVKYYSDWAGYQPGNPATDQGYNEDSFLTLWEQQTFCGEKLLGHLDADPQNLTHVRAALAFFGPQYVGCTLPNSVWRQDTWDVAADDGGIDGGHCMVLVDCDPDFVWFVTWGKIQRATWAWWLRYVDETHPVLLESWARRYPGAAVETLLNVLKVVS